MTVLSIEWSILEGWLFDNMIYLTGFNPINDHIDDNILLKAHRNFAVSYITKAAVMNAPIPEWVQQDAFRK